MVQEPEAVQRRTAWAAVALAEEVAQRYAVALAEEEYGFQE